MELSHRTEGQSRIDAVKQVLEKHRAKLAELKQQKIELRVFGFDRELQPFAVESGKVQLPEKVDGSQTDMGTSIAQSFRGNRSKRMVGSILMGDGRRNIVQPEVAMQQALQFFKDLQVPLYSIAFGQEGDAGQFSDLAITGMLEQYSIQVKNELVVNATLKTRGFVNREIPVQLILTDSSGKSEVVQTVRKTVTKQEQEIPLEFNYIPESPGQYTINVVAENQPQELVVKNNYLPAFLTVDAKGLRVLYVRGSEGAEQLFLKKSIGAAKGIGIDVVYIDPGSRPRWPFDRRSLFENSLYDVIIFHNVDVAAFYKKGDDRSCLSSLVSQIEKGKGFLMIGGDNGFDKKDFDETPLGAIMPVQMSRFDRKIPGPVVAKPVRRHFLTNLFPAENEKNWMELPPLSSIKAFERVKDSGRILLESNDKDPIMVQGNFGGRILLFSGDSTWKWWTSGKKDIHKRFWRQVILWLARRDGTQNDNIFVNLPQRRIEPELDVRFTCEANSTLGDRLVDAAFKATLVAPDGTENEINVSKSKTESSGTIQGDLLTEPGNYSLTVSATHLGRDLGETKIEFVVLDRDSEKANPLADPGRLSRMAKQTEQWGGRAVPPEEFGSLIDEIIAGREDENVEVQRKWELGDTWKDAMAVVIGFAVLFGTEWFFRKKWGLV